MMKAIKQTLAFLLCVLLVTALGIPAFADDAQVISEVQLTVTQPKVGEAPDGTIVSAEPDKYTATVRHWLKQPYPYDSDNPVTAFESGCNYTVVFWVTPVNGYRFETVQKNQYNFEESPTRVYVNGKLAHCVSAETDGKLGRAFDFGQPEEEPGKTELSFFARILQSIRDFFAKIRDFFAHLF